MSPPIPVTAPCDDLRIVLRRAAVLALCLRDPSGAPLQRGTKIWLGEDHDPVTCSTDADGRLRLECEARGTVEIRLFTWTFPAVVRNIRLVAGEVADLGDVTLQPPRRVRVRVVDSAGRAIVRARIDQAGDDFGYVNDFDVEVATPPMIGDPLVAKLPAVGPDGEYDVTFAPPSGPMSVRVQADGYLTLRRTVTVDGDAPITLTLQRGGVLWGEVVDEGDLAVSGAHVRAIDERGAGTPLTADALGRFDIRLAPGTYVVRAEGCDDTTVDLRESGDTHVRLVAR